MPPSPKSKCGKEKGGEEENPKKEASIEKMKEESSSELPAVKDEKQGRLSLPCALKPHCMVSIKEYSSLKK